MPCVRVASPTPTTQHREAARSSAAEASIARAAARSGIIASRMCSSAAGPQRAYLLEGASSFDHDGREPRCSVVERSTSRRSWSSKWARVAEPMSQGLVELSAAQLFVGALLVLDLLQRLAQLGLALALGAAVRTTRCTRSGVVCRRPGAAR